MAMKSPLCRELQERYLANPVVPTGAGGIGAPLRAYTPRNVTERSLKNSMICFLRTAIFGYKPLPKVIMENVSLLSMMK